MFNLVDLLNWSLSKTVDIVLIRCNCTVQSLAVSRVYMYACTSAVRSYLYGKLIIRHVIRSYII